MNTESKKWKYIFVAIMVIVGVSFVVLLDKKEQNEEPASHDVVEDVDNSSIDTTQDTKPVVRNVVVPEDTVTEAAKVTEDHDLSLDTLGNEIINWDFAGAYANNDNAVKKALLEVERLLADMDEAYTEYDTALSVGNQYYYIGDGENAFEYYKKAIISETSGSGLAWYNMGNLLNRIGAHESSRYSYEQALELKENYSYRNALELLVEDYFSE
jgi:tetratricopeptide (TPR) repeat protein